MGDLLPEISRIFQQGLLQCSEITIPFPIVRGGSLCPVAGGREGGRETGSRLPRVDSSIVCLKTCYFELCRNRQTLTTNITMR